jgi:hypothetical protein
MHLLRRVAPCVLLVLALTATACGGDDDDVAASDDTATTTTVADDTTTTSVADDADAVGADPCPLWAAWMSDGKRQSLVDLEAALHDDPSAGEILDSIDYLLSDPPTATAEDQSSFEGAVDTITADLQDWGCTTG